MSTKKSDPLYVTVVASRGDFRQARVYTSSDDRQERPRMAWCCLWCSWVCLAPTLDHVERNGTGRLLQAIREATGGSAIRTAVELDPRLCDHLRAAEEGATIVQGDFLQFIAPAEGFDRVVMNPPFSGSQRHPCRNLR